MEILFVRIYFTLSLKILLQNVIHIYISSLLHSVNLHLFHLKPFIISTSCHNSLSMKIMINNGNLSNIFSIRDKTRQTGNVICLSIHNIFILFPISNHTLLYEFPIVLPTKNVMAIYL